MRVPTVSLLAAVAGLSFAVSSANANFLVRITVEVDETAAGGQHFENSWDLGEASSPDPFQWSAGSLTGESTSLWETPNGVVVHGLAFTLHADPSITNNFNITQGATNSIITVHSSVVNHPGQPCDFGRAEAVLGITNSLAVPDGATVVGLQGGSAFRSFYNGASVFSDLLPGESHAGSFVLQGETSGPGVYLPLGGIATSIETEFKFSLSPRDRATGTSLFEVIPAPSSAVAIALGGLVAGRRRRS